MNKVYNRFPVSPTSREKGRKGEMSEKKVAKNGVVRGKDVKQPGSRMDGKLEGSVRVVISGDKVCECVCGGGKMGIRWRKGGRKRRGEGFHPEKDGCSDTGREEVEEY